MPPWRRRSSAGRKSRSSRSSPPTGSTPQRVGAKMLVYPDGRTVGTIGGGCYENDAFWKAREAIKARRPLNVKYELNDDFAQETGLVCGGQMEVFIEPVEASPDVYVFGAGHVGYCVAKHGARRRLPRPRHRRPREVRQHRAVRRGHRRRRRQHPAAGSQQHTLPPTAYAVIVTRGHTHDLDALRALTAAAAALSRARSAARRRCGASSTRLLEEGVPPTSRCKAVHAPIGLDIGAITPQEIAVSIVAELIAAKHGKITEPNIAAVSMRWEGALRK